MSQCAVIHVFEILSIFAGYCLNLAQDVVNISKDWLSILIVKTVVLGSLSASIVSNFVAFVGSYYQTS